MPDPDNTRRETSNHPRLDRSNPPIIDRLEIPNAPSKKKKTRYFYIACHGSDIGIYQRGSYYFKCKGFLSYKKVQKRLRKEGMTNPVIISIFEFKCEQDFKDFKRGDK